MATPCRCVWTAGTIVRYRLAVCSMPLLVRTDPVCPKCGGKIRHSSASLCRCAVCSMDFHITMDIVDLRYPQCAEESEVSMDLCGELVRRYSTCSYAELLDLYYSRRDLSYLPEHIVLSLRKDRAGQLARGSRFVDMFLSRLSDFLGTPNCTASLEIGCGTGAGLVRLAQRSQRVVGLDASLPNLILARKFCEENGIAPVQLVQAYAERMPFRASSFTYITAQNVLEHVVDIGRVLLEAARVLVSDGCFAADSRNRYDLVMREPHVKVRWVGMLPREWANRYVHARTGIRNYDQIAHLLSYWELRDALGRAFGRSHRIVIPRVEAYGIPREIDTMLGFLERLWGIGDVLTWFFPSHLALARKLR